MSFWNKKSEENPQHIEPGISNPKEPIRSAIKFSDEPIMTTDADRALGAQRPVQPEMNREIRIDTAASTNNYQSPMGNAPFNQGQTQQPAAPKGQPDSIFATRPGFNPNAAQEGGFVRATQPQQSAQVNPMNAAPREFQLNQQQPQAAYQNNQVPNRNQFAQTAQASSQGALNSAASQGGEPSYQTPSQAPNTFQPSQQPSTGPISITTPSQPVFAQNSAPQAPQAAEPIFPAPQKPKTSFFSRLFKKGEPAKSHEQQVDDELIQQQRFVRARTRFIGAAMLLVAVAIALPLLFDKEPPPPSVTIPLRIPNENSVDVTKITVPFNKSDSAQTNSSEPVVVTTEPKDKGAQSAKPAVKEPEKAKPQAPAAEAKDKAAEKVQPAKPAQDAKPAKPAQPAAAKQDVKPAAAKDDKQKAAANAKAADNAKNSKPAAKETAEPKAAKLAKGNYYIQVIATKDEARANQLKRQIISNALPAYVESVATASGKVWRVRIGPFNDKAQAEAARAKIGLAGIASGTLHQVK